MGAKAGDRRYWRLNLQSPDLIMCYHLLPPGGGAEASSEDCEIRRKSASSRVVQALRDFRSPMQLRKKIKQNCSKINITEGLRNVGGKASARVVRGSHKLRVGGDGGC